ncbi:CRISPR/Cas system CSM-associated protein Csm3, group 7 of RAMP superfamily [Tessaracoccus bendigoensis DSM 12906]|uniref:CRISPR/Cas system CSM-associated protein Csm3, group 7 of RAMP superfamily n=1 Tax=Tessaracoccus bendigoensis DSM 12906 TaxID=1123357 RepID=A0A1M6JKA6_9ACTN|nr:RAMP superfamily CRISPR-associated protein [Tessaracoccus bendigoensis]SHJ47099.1 CRISPR/Cas system CSM-associated protein Csm3, group 7 of RAMP superfamily [Tessaracoccus bendigoensis DSM 12906]
MTTSKITLLRVEIELLQPWAVGGVADLNDTIDLPVQRDPRSEPSLPYVPSTSLIGALRRHLEPNLGDDCVKWLGPLPVPHEQSTGSVVRTASRLRALGTRVVAGQQIVAFGSTQIDPKRRAAAGGTLRTEQRVEALTRADEGRPAPTLAWYLQHDGEADSALLDCLEKWQPYVGRRRSSGHGRARVSRVVAFTVDLTNPDGLTWWLEGRHGWLEGCGNPPRDVTVVERHGAALAGPAWHKSFDWKVVEPVHIGANKGETTGAPASTDGSKAAPGLTRKASNAPVIPGTTWKGLFRHRIDAILRLCGATDEECTSVSGRLFGRSGQSRARTTGHRGCLRFLDAALTTPDGRKPARLVVRTHVAIDRISGGAHEGLLFAVEAVDEGARAVGVIESDTLLPPEVENLLHHVVRDIHDGFLGVGAGTTRGYGRLACASGSAPTVTPIDVGAIVRWAEGSGVQGRQK